MGVCNSPDIFQDKISKLFKGFYIVWKHISNIRKITKEDIADHLKSLEKVLHKLSELVIKVNAYKSFFD